MRAFAPAAGTRIAYDDTGDGPALVFLHAGIAHRAMWEPQVAAFGGRYRCITPDVRGFGDTTVGTEPFSRRDDLAAVLDAAGVNDAVVVGCSIGAGVALDFAIERPEKVTRLVLVGVTPAGFDHPGDDALRHTGRLVEAAVARGDYEESGRLEARFWADGPRRSPGSAPAWLLEQVAGWAATINQRQDWGESLQLDPPAMTRLDEVVVPTLVMVGTEDADLVIAGCRAAAAGIPGAELVELPGTAHLPSLEVPAAFNTALAGFLD